MKKFGGRRLIAAAAVAAALSATAAIVVPHTLGFFDASTKNTGNSFATGTLTMANSKSNAAILTATNMKPGGQATGTVVITNSGSLPATMTLSESNVVGGASVSGVMFAHDLQVTIVDDATPTPNTIYSGSLDSLSSGTALPPTTGTQWTAGEHHTYTFTVTFPNAASNADNGYQNTTASAEFDWYGIQ